MAEEFIGNYKILKKIGAGGMAQVFLAVHKDVPNLKVVLKILSDARLAERFRQEADKLALLDGHSSVCRIKHFFNHGDDFVIAMEFIDGQTLEDRIKDEGKLAIGDSLKIISDVLSTLEFAHQKDIFHRDIKPGNIMVDLMGQVKIIDFGIAKSKTDPNLTIAGTSCGTPAYMPPEQFNPTESINYAQVDVYASGTTLFYMLTGDLPFKGDNQFALRDAKMFNEPARPRELNPDIPKKVEEVILKALAKDPQDRYASAAEMKTAIDALRVDVAPSAPAGVKPSAKPSPAPRSEKPASKKIPIISALVVIVCAVGAYFIFFGKSAPTPPEAPVPLLPVENARLQTALPTFTWQGSGEGGTTYLLEYAVESNFIDPIEEKALSAASYTASEEFADGLYYWRVRAVDGEGNKSPYSQTMSFMIETVIPATPEATLSITVRPQGDIYVDGELIGRNRSEAVATLDTGSHVVRVVNSRSEQKELSKSIALAGGAREAMSFEFTFPPQTAKVDSGEVAIGSSPIDGGIIFIDGHPQELTTNNTFRLPVGKHIIKVVLTLDGEQREKIDSVIVEKDGLARKKFDFEN